MKDESDLPPIEEPKTNADAWADGPVFYVKEMSADELSACVDQFIQAGGRIQEVQPGLRTDETTTFNSRIVNFCRGSTNIQNTHDREFADKVYGQDAALVEKLTPLLQQGMNRKEISEAMGGMSDDRFQRLLRMYFKDDLVAAKYMRVTREERELISENESERVEKLRNAFARGLDRTEARKSANCSCAMMYHLVSKHNIQIPETA